METGRLENECQDSGSGENCKSKVELLYTDRVISCHSHNSHTCSNAAAGTFFCQRVGKNGTMCL